MAPNTIELSRLQAITTLQATKSADHPPDAENYQQLLEDDTAFMHWR